MDSQELDSGDIIDKEFFQLKDNTYIQDVYNWMDKTIPNLFLKNILKLKLQVGHQI